MPMNDKDAQHSQHTTADAGVQASAMGGDTAVAEQMQQPEALSELLAESDVSLAMPANEHADAHTDAHHNASLDALVDSASATAFVPAFQPPGKLLAARREELRWSLDEAALRLKLTPRQVSALEADDYASLPGMASVRGFVRSYAKLVGLDPQLLLDSLASEQNPAHSPMVLRRPLPSNGFPGRRSSPPPRRSKWSSRVILGVIVLAAIAGALYEAVQSQWLELPEDLAMEVSLPTLPSFGLESNEPVAALQAAAQAAAQATVEAVSTEKKAPPSGPRLPSLDIKLHEDAWVEITTLNGEKIVSRLMKAGTSESFDVSEPVVLVVGNASAVDARFRGQSLNLKAIAHDNVSKLNLK